MRAATIFGVSSGAGRAGVAVVRLSGPHVGAVWQSLCERPLPPPRVATLTTLRTPSSRALLDRCLALYFPGPRSFSGEDMLELHVHGAPAVLNGLAESLVTLPGVRPAEAGEFSRRAWDNGKLSLLEVEALADLVRAETSAQREQALRQLGGELGRLYEGWRARTIALLARVEAVIDFADGEDVDAGVLLHVGPAVQVLAAEMRSHLHDGRRGELVREGARLALAGPPNSGKSSLYNMLLRRQAAIVSALPGTTRDVLEAPLDVAGFAVRLADTAGLRDTADPVELEGIARGSRCYQDADLRVLVVDASAGIAEAEAAWARLSRAPSLVVVNKCDLVLASADLCTALRARLQPVPVVPMSCTTPAAFQDQLLEALAMQLRPHQACAATPVLTRARHRVHLTAACERLEAFGAAYATGAELAAEELRHAVHELARVAGHATVDDTLDVLFREFCIGK